MAGWLFADLMLVLFVVGLGSQATAYPAPLPTPTASSTPTPTPTPTRPPALSKKPVTVNVKVDFADLLGTGAARARAADKLKNDVSRGLKKRHLASDRAGMVLVWAYHDDVDYGLRVSQAVASQLPKASKSFFGDTSIRTFWRGARGHSSRVDLEIYILK